MTLVAKNPIYFPIILLYCHLLIHAEIYIYIYIYIYILDTYRRNDKDTGRLLYRNMYLLIYCKGSKRLFKVCVWEGAGDRTETSIFWPPLLWPATLCLSHSPDAQPEAQRPTLLGDGFFYCILSASSLDPNSSGFLRAPSAGCGFPYHTSSFSFSNSTATPTSVLTELYNSSTPTRSPTRSLEWHDWSSSSGNNCHAVHRSLSSGALFYECIMGCTLSHFISQIHPRDLFRLLAIGMCHFLPVHHFVMACLLRPKVQIQQYSLVWIYWSNQYITLSASLRKHWLYSLLMEKVPLKTVSWVWHETNLKMRQQFWRLAECRLLLN